MRIVSPQTQHGTGLNLAVGLNGPLMVRDVEVEGFAFGVRTGNAINSVTLEHVTVRNQGAAGWLNIQQVASARRFVSEQENAIPALINGSNKGAAQHWFGTVTLLDCEFTTTHPDGAPYAIEAVGNTIAHDITINGYDNAALAKRAGFLGGQETPIPLEGPGIVRWLKSYRVNNNTPFFETALFSVPDPSPIGLEILETPDVPWDDPAEWVNLADFAAGDGVTDDTGAFQAAIDSMKPGGVNHGKTTLLVPHGSAFRIIGEVEISGPVRRIIGTKGRIRGEGVGRLRIVDSPDQDAPILRIERLSGFASQFFLEHASSRTVAVVNTTGVRFIGAGAGDLFIEDIVGGFHHFQQSGQRIWARQFNAENEGTKIVNDGAMLWMLGVKTEKFGTILETRKDGVSELYGGLVYRVDLTAADDAPMFVIDNARTFITGVGEYDPTQNQTRQYENIVRETRGADQMTAGKSFFPETGRHNGSTVVTHYRSETNALGDLNGDGSVGSADLAILLGSWGPCPSVQRSCIADLTGDGAVGSADLGILLGLWGSGSD
ncbi:MAG: hypothetical protein EA376_12975 [Phycisphaeraceae bacterium]|nr:MAG: hypothetical protein EA376_12975 [Phycisphaeraceae bacterium]